jgi:hypothetical protein
MKSISISASPKQLSRLRNGHRVRIKSPIGGTGIALLVDPSKFDAASRSFLKGSAYQMQLSPDELMANRSAVQEGEIEGQGIFAGGKLSFKKMGKVLKKGGETTLGGLKAGEAEVRKNPVSRAIIKEGAPLLVEEGIKAAWVAKGGDPKTGAKLGKVGAAGTKAGLKEVGYGLYAGSSGRGIMGSGISPVGGAMCGGALPAPRSRMPEMSSLSIGGNLLSRSMNPALQSDAMGANFAMNTQLPPSFQRGGIRFV